MQVNDSFGNSINTVKGKQSLNEVYKLQGTSLLQGYSQQKNNYLGSQISTSKQMNRESSQVSLNKRTAESGRSQQHQDANQESTSFKINLNKINEQNNNGGSNVNNNKTERYEQS